MPDFVHQSFESTCSLSSLAIACRRGGRRWHGAWPTWAKVRLPAGEAGGGKPRKSNMLSQLRRIAIDSDASPVTPNLRAQRILRLLPRLAPHFQHPIFSVFSVLSVLSVLKYSTVSIAKSQASAEHPRTHFAQSIAAISATTPHLSVLFAFSVLFVPKNSTARLANSPTRTERPFASKTPGATHA